MRFLSVYSGIGAHDKGLEDAGHRCVGQIEVDPFCRAVLEKHWPGLPRWSDVREARVDYVKKACGRIDLITGGFACQDISTAGRIAGLTGDTRSGLTWRELFRLTAGLRPRGLVIENVPNLRNHGADDVLAKLAALDYACWPVVVGARHAGAPHQRDRVWIVGLRVEYAERPVAREWRERLRAWESDELVHAAGEHGEQRLRQRKRATAASGQKPRFEGPSEIELADPKRQHGRRGECESQRQSQGRTAADGSGKVTVAESDGGRRRDGEDAGTGRAEPVGDSGRMAGGDGDVADAERVERIERHESELLGRPTHETKQTRVGSNRNRWPACPGEQQHAFEEPRLVKFEVGRSASGITPGLVRTVAGIRGCSDGDAVQWFKRNKVEIDRRQNREALRALGNCNPPAVIEMIGRRFKAMEERGC